MLSLVLAAAVTTGAEVPNFGWRSGHGCHGCYGGGNAFSCYGGGCGGCYGCYGGCSGSSCYGASCFGCYGGCYGGACYGGCYGYGRVANPFYTGYCSGYGAGCYGGYSGYMAPPVSTCGGYGGFGCVGAGMAVPTPAPAMMQAAPTVTTTAQASPTGTPATVVVKAPADVRMTVNDQLLVWHGGERSFRTPDLLPGKTYAYDFKVEAVRDGKTVTRAKRVEVRPGEQTLVSFDDVGGPNTGAPAKVAVQLPEGAKLFVDGVPAPAATFQTPHLEAGRAYFYELKVEVVRDGRTFTEDRRVALEAGKEVTVEFKAPDVLRTAGR